MPTTIIVQLQHSFFPICVYSSWSTWTAPAIPCQSDQIQGHRSVPTSAHNLGYRWLYHQECRNKFSKKLVVTWVPLSLEIPANEQTAVWSLEKFQCLRHRKDPWATSLCPVLTPPVVVVVRQATVAAHLALMYPRCPKCLIHWQFYTLLGRQAVILVILKCWLGAKLLSGNISHCVVHSRVPLSGSQNISPTSTLSDQSRC